jgi:alpha-ketoglutarate-dependent taurine dioxygenase
MGLEPKQKTIGIKGSNMNKKPISKLFEHEGLIISKTSDEEVYDLNYREVVSLFEQQGIIVLRDFNLEPDELRTFTDLYTDTYASDALRRAIRTSQKGFRSVDLEIPDVELHSEASFAPAWPEIIWLYCNEPPLKNGATIFCDGIRLWKSLSAKAKDFFMENPIRYDTAIPIAEKKPGKGKRPWALHSLGTSQGHIDWETGLLHIIQTRFAVHESRIPNNLCFANHLLITVETEPQLLARKMINGEEIPQQIMEEIHKKSEELTYDFIWEKRDLIMLDNKRFFHGRRPIEKGDPRDIIIAQTSKASFGYGSTTRRQKRSS